jgi:hypothetical protein
LLNSHLDNSGSIGFLVVDNKLVWLETGLKCELGLFSQLNRKSVAIPHLEDWACQGDETTTERDSALSIKASHTNVGKKLLRRCVVACGKKVSVSIDGVLCAPCCHDTPSSHGLR